MTRTLVGALCFVISCFAAPTSACGQTISRGPPTVMSSFAEIRELFITALPDGRWVIGRVEAGKKSDRIRLPMPRSSRLPQPNPDLGLFVCIGLVPDETFEMLVLVSCRPLYWDWNWRSGQTVFDAEQVDASETEAQLKRVPVFSDGQNRMSPHQALSDRRGVPVVVYEQDRISLLQALPDGSVVFSFEGWTIRCATEEAHSDGVGIVLRECLPVMSRLQKDRSVIAAERERRAAERERQRRDAERREQEREQLEALRRANVPGAIEKYLNMAKESPSQFDTRVLAAARPSLCAPGPEQPPVMLEPVLAEAVLASFLTVEDAATRTLFSVRLPLLRSIRDSFERLVLSDQLEAPADGALRLPAGTPDVPHCG